MAAFAGVASDKKDDPEALAAMRRAMTDDTIPFRNVELANRFNLSEAEVCNTDNYELMEFGCALNTRGLLSEGKLSVFNTKAGFYSDILGIKKKVLIDMKEVRNLVYELVSKALTRQFA